MRRIAVLAAALAALAVTGASAIVVNIGPREIDRALTIARGRDADRARFHAAYGFALEAGPRQAVDPTVERVEVITELRRVVLAAEERRSLADHVFGAREAENVLRPWRGRVAMLARLRFHPQNAYVTVPPIELVLANHGGGGEIKPRTINRTPIYPSPGALASVIVGADVEAVFDAAPLAQARRRLLVRLEARTLASVTIDFSAID